MNRPWEARVKGGRRALLKLAALGSVEWLAVGVRNAVLSVLLMRLWNAVTARRERPKARIFTYTGIIPMRIRLASTYRFVPGQRPDEMA